MKKPKFFPGFAYFSPEVITKATSKVSTALTMTEAIEQTGLDEAAIKEKYSTFRVDDVTFVQL